MQSLSFEHYSALAPVSATMQTVEPVSSQQTETSVDFIPTQFMEGYSPYYTTPAFSLKETD